MRYCARHLTLNRAGIESVLKRSLDIRITRVELSNNQLVITGHSDADRIVAELDNMRRAAIPDAQEAFSITIPNGKGVLRLCCHKGDAVTEHRFTPFRASTLASARLKLLPAFLFAIGGAVPAAIRWFRNADPTARVEVRDRLGLAPLVHAQEINGDVLTPSSPPSLAGVRGITIIMPIYNAFDVLQEALDRVRLHTHIQCRLILIEDCSTDSRVRPYLRKWIGTIANSDHLDIELIENEQNLGFIGAVNRGLRHTMTRDPGDAVILLNSDALVPEHWAARIVAPIIADDGVASVTPFSNDAELLTIPTLSRPHDLVPGVADRIDLMARQLSTTLTMLEEAAMPTGVGFCMALNPNFLNLVPEFDTAFGAGYGEEVDWCQKIVRVGGRHVACSNLFVEHRGGASFGSEEKQRLLLKNSAEISRRYPHFDQQVQDFIAADPLLTHRLALGLAWAAAQGEIVPVYIAHSMGGGAELDLRRRIAHDIAQDQVAVVIRVGGVSRWHIELHSSTGMSEGASNDDDMVVRLIHLLPARRIIYSCGVGSEDAANLPSMLTRLNDPSTGQLEFLIHDYLPVSPSYTLLGAKGRFEGMPDVGNSDAAHQSRQADGTFISLAEWRTRWGSALSKAQRIEVFSTNSAALLLEAYPDLADRVEIRPHEQLHLFDPVPLPTQSQPVIGILGNIGKHKGAEIVAQIARLLAERRIGKLIIIGNFDPSIRLHRSVRVHGDYEHSDIPALVARYGIDRWLIPSIWPETFSFTTHEALATGLPVFVFDLGAQGDAVAKRYGKANVIPLPGGLPDAEDVLRRLTSQQSTASGDRDKIA